MVDYQGRSALINGQFQIVMDLPYILNVINLIPDSFAHYTSAIFDRCNERKPCDRS